MARTAVGKMMDLMATMFVCRERECRVFVRCKIGVCEVSRWFVLIKLGVVIECCCGITTPRSRSMVSMVSYIEFVGFPNQRDTGQAARADAKRSRGVPTSSIHSRRIPRLKF